MISLKILVVDDDREKIRAIIEHLTSIRISRDWIEVARDAQEAKRLISGTKYDILILDMAIPNRVEDEARVQIGIDLLDEISEKREYFAPKYIVCITAMEEEMATIEEEFVDRYWQIVRYNEHSNHWKSKITDTVTHSLRDKDSIMQDRYLRDVFIMTALPTPELNAVHALPIEWSDTKYLDNIIPYKEGALDVSGNRISFIACSASSMGMVSTAVTATIMLRNFRPRIAIMSGICAGFSERTKLGDLIISDPAWDYQTGKIVGSQNGPLHKMEIRQTRLDHALSVRLKDLAGTEGLIPKLEIGWMGDRPGSPPNIIVGASVSGSAVIASAEKMAEISGQDRKLLSLDMEVAAFYVACSTAISPPPLYFAAKTITDVGTAEKGDRIQPYGSMLSAKFVLEFAIQNIMYIRSGR